MKRIRNSPVTPQRTILDIHFFQTLTMTKVCFTPSIESLHAADDGRDLYQPSPQDLVERSTYNSTGVQARCLSLEITHTPTNTSMSPLPPFAEWAKHYEDYESHGTSVEDVDIDRKQLPFSEETFPTIVLKQLDAWMDIVVHIHRMLDDPGEWDREVDRDYGVESLEIFRNLLMAPRGLTFEHLTNGGTTKLARLGPCAPVHEIRAAVVESKVCAYYEYQPFNELEALLANYKRLLRKTDANPSRRRRPEKRNMRRYDQSIDREMHVLIRDVEKILEAREALMTELDDIPEVGGDWGLTIAQIHKDDNELSEKLQRGQEIAHWHYQMLHYIKARALEKDVNAIPTVMQVYNREGDYHKPNNGPNFKLPSNWQEEIDAARSQGRGPRKSASSRQQPPREPLQSLLLRVRPFLEVYDDSDDEGDADTIIPESEYATSESQSESGYSGYCEADSEESTRTGTSVSRRIRPDWTSDYANSGTESESESDSESETDAE